MNIVLGITGSIAAYKACTLIRQFVKQGHEVQVVITPAGKEFITPITLIRFEQSTQSNVFFLKCISSIVDNFLMPMIYTKEENNKIDFLRKSNQAF